MLREYCLRAVDVRLLLEHDLGEVLWWRDANGQRRLGPKCGALLHKDAIDGSQNVLGFLAAGKKRRVARELDAGAGTLVCLLCLMCLRVST